MSFFSSLLGKDSAKAAQQLGQRNAGQINQGYEQAGQAAKTGYDQSMGYINPYAQSGQRGQSAYENTLGLHGQQAAQDNLQAMSQPFPVRGQPRAPTYDWTSGAKQSGEAGITQLKGQNKLDAVYAEGLKEKDVAAFKASIARKMAGGICLGAARDHGDEARHLHPRPLLRRPPQPGLPRPGRPGRR